MATAILSCHDDTAKCGDGTEGRCKEKLSELMTLAVDLRAICDARPHIQGMQKLRKKCQAELKFLKGVSVWKWTDANGIPSMYLKDLDINNVQSQAVGSVLARPVFNLTTKPKQKT